MFNNRLTYFNKNLPFYGGVLVLLIILQGCTDTPDDEKYSKIEGRFPKLVDVPDRPHALSAREIDQKKHQLDADRHEAEKLAEQNHQMAMQ